MFASGDVAGALRSLEDCVKRNPNNSAMLNDYGVALLADKQVYPAIDAFTAAIAIGNNSQASYNRYVLRSFSYSLRYCCSHALCCT